MIKTATQEDLICVAGPLLAPVREEFRQQFDDLTQIVDSLRSAVARLTAHQGEQDVSLAGYRSDTRQRIEAIAAQQDALAVTAANLAARLKAEEHMTQLALEQVEATRQNLTRQHSDVLTAMARAENAR